jgi:hypothetical protein
MPHATLITVPVLQSFCASAADPPAHRRGGGTADQGRLGSLLHCKSAHTWIR